MPIIVKLFTTLIFMHDLLNHNSSSMQIARIIRPIIFRRWMVERRSTSRDIQPLGVVGPMIIHAVREKCSGKVQQWSYNGVKTAAVIRTVIWEVNAAINTWK